MIAVVKPGCYTCVNDIEGRREVTEVEEGCSDDVVDRVQE